MAQDRCVSMTRTWGFLATDVPDPPECILSCRRDFLRGLSLGDETLDVVCEALSDNASATAVVSVSVPVSESAPPSASTTNEPDFWALYCCDAQRCGVDNLRSVGQDPNVNWFINSCQNIGHSSIIDPGPPDLAYSCDSSITDRPDTATRCENQPEQSPEAESNTSPSTTTQTSEATQTYSTIHDPSLEASFDPGTQSEGNRDGSNSNSNDSDDDTGDGLSTGVKVTIALVTVAAVAIIALGVFAFLRYRRRPPHHRDLRQYLKGKYHSLYPSKGGQSTRPAPSSPAQPLLSPKLSQTDRDGVPLTPPPPLKERRLLSDVNPSPHNDSYRRHVRTYSATTHSMPRIGLLTAPPASVFDPNKGNLARRSGASVGLPPVLRSQSGLPVGPTAPLSPPTSPRGWTGSQRSVSTGPTTSIASTISAKGTSRITSTGTLNHRPRAATFDAASLQSPGPPPNRALPLTPPNSFIGQSPTSPSAPCSQPGEMGVTAGLVSRNPANGVVLDRASQELCDLTEQTYREWQGASSRWSSGRRAYSGGSAGPPPAVAHRSTESVRVGSPLLEEVDLERMAGGY